MEIWADIEGHHSPGMIEGVEHLQDITLRRGLLARPFDVNHAASALGFTLVDVRHKLKPEFHGKSGPQLVALKKEGVAIEERVEIPLLTYTGDTACGRWLKLDFVRETRALILECTFFEREHVSRARAGKHIHVVDLPEILEAIPDAQVLLSHLTRRTDIRAAKRILERTLKPSDAERVSFLMDRPPRHRDNSAAASPQPQRAQTP